MATTNSTTITDTQIRQLADDAGWHGDYTMMAICEIALTGACDPKLDRLLNDEDRAIVAQFPSQAAARAECARVLAEQAAGADQLGDTQMPSQKNSHFAMRQGNRRGEWATYCGRSVRESSIVSLAHADWITCKECRKAAMAARDAMAEEEAGGWMSGRVRREQE